MAPKPDPTLEAIEALTVALNRLAEAFEALPAELQAQVAATAALCSTIEAEAGETRALVTAACRPLRSWLTDGRPRVRIRG